MKSDLILRARVISGIFILIAALLIVRAYFVQIVDGGQYRREAMGQYVAAAPETADRGTIYFTTKDGALVPAAVMQAGWRIAITPKDIENAASTYAALNAVTPVDRTRFMSSAAKKDDPYEEVAFRVSDADAQKIRALNLPGVLLVQDEWRDYPAGVLAAQTVGFVGYLGNNTSKTGVYGLERSWQNTLTRTSSELYVNPFAQIFTNVQSLVASDPAAEEGDVITSIEPNVQAQLETTLNQVMQTYSPQVAGGIIMNPKTGEIYAMAARPAFDPNDYSDVSSASVYMNPLVEGRYELGSIMKPITMAAALDSGAVTPQTTYDDTGCVTRSGKRVCNWDFVARGVIPMQQIISQSLNVGATFLADTMGHPVQTKYMKAFGFDEKTGIDLPNEVVGDLSPLGDGTGPDVNYATASFGQGVAVSPIEMTRALAAIANDGVLSNPHVVTGVRYDTGITRTIDPGQGSRVISTTTANEVTNMMIVFYDQALAQGTLKFDHYSVAAKTGTAQVPMPGGGYYPNTYLHSFVGFFPAHDPQFIIFLFQNEPHGVEYASASLSQPFYDLAKYVINYYNVQPDR